MKPYWRTVLPAWGALLLLIALEVALTFVKLGWAGPAILVVLAGATLSIVAAVFMRLLASSQLAQGFALAAAIWFAILIGLSGVDRFTRTDYAVPIVRSP